MAEAASPGGARATRAIELLAVVLGVLFLALVLFSAWLSDDSYIVFRVVENLWLGHGLRWNISERVQAFTCPLWTLLLIPARALVGHAPMAAHVLHGLIAFGIVRFFARLLAHDPSRLCLILAALCGSKAIVEFATSGLENGLGALLLVLFAAATPGAATDGRRGMIQLALGGVLVFHRLDHALLVAPAAGWTLFHLPRTDRLRALAAGATVPLLWEAFSLVYYGDLVPNTAHAKLGLDGKRGVLLRSGLDHLLFTVRHDPVTTLVLVSGLHAAWRGPVERRFLALGALLYAAWVTWIGGDFMGGRFFVSPSALVLGAWAIGPSPLPRAWHVGLAAGVVALAAAWPASPFRASPEDGWSGSYEVVGTIDERLYYYRAEGLLSPNHQWRRPGPDGTSIHVVITGMIGVAGYEAGPTVHLLDPIGLSDPLIARMPPQDPSLYGFRPGHVQRAIPVGYVESLQGGRNVVASPVLAGLWRDLELATRAPIRTEGRAAAILRVLRWDGLSKQEPAPSP